MTVLESEDDDEAEAVGDGGLGSVEDGLEGGEESGDESVGDGGSAVWERCSKVCDLVWIRKGTEMVAFEEDSFTVRLGVV